MLASEVIEKLVAYKNRVGDLPVKLLAYDSNLPWGEDTIDCDVTGVTDRGINRPQRTVNFIVIMGSKY